MDTRTNFKFIILLGIVALLTKTVEYLIFEYFTFLGTFVKTVLSGTISVIGIQIIVSKVIKGKFKYNIKSVIDKIKKHFYFSEKFKANLIALLTFTTVFLSLFRIWTGTYWFTTYEDLKILKLSCYVFIFLMTLYFTVKSTYKIFANEETDLDILTWTKNQFEKIIGYIFISFVAIIPFGLFYIYFEILTISVNSISSKQYNFPKITETKKSESFRFPNIKYYTLKTEKEDFHFSHKEQKGETLSFKNNDFKIGCLGIIYKK